MVNFSKMKAKCGFYYELTANIVVFANLAGLLLS